METYGHAVVVDPWGKVLLNLGEAAYDCRVVELRIDGDDAVRKMLPVLLNVAPAAYRVPIELIESTT
jgi:deaminated glutathione amidase